MYSLNLLQHGSENNRITTDHFAVQLSLVILKAVSRSITTRTELILRNDTTVLCTFQQKKHRLPVTWSQLNTTCRDQDNESTKGLVQSSTQHLTPVSIGHFSSSSCKSSV